MNEITKVITETSSTNWEPVVEFVKYTGSGVIGGIVALVGRFLLERKLTIHKLQFQNEFEIYKKLWAKLVVLKDAAEDMLKVILVEDLSVDVIEKRLVNIHGKTLDEIYGEMFEVIEKNKPFYAPDIYVNAEELLREMGNLHSWASFSDIGAKVDSESAKNNLRRIEEIIGKTEKSIRERIGTMRKAKIIG